MIKVITAPVQTLVHAELRKQWEDEIYVLLKRLRDNNYVAQPMGPPVAEEGAVIMLLSIGKPMTIDLGGQIQQRITPADPKEIRDLLEPKPDAPRVRKV